MRDSRHENALFDVVARNVKRLAVKHACKRG